MRIILFFSYEITWENIEKISPPGFEHGSSSLVVECSTSEPFLLYNIIEIILEECILAIRT
jgi:hypothetical protein